MYREGFYYQSGRVDLPERICSVNRDDAMTYISHIQWAWRLPGGGASILLSRHGPRPMAMMEQACHWGIWRTW